MMGMDIDIMQIARASQDVWQAGFEQGKIVGRRQVLEEAARAAEEAGYPLFAEELRRMKRGLLP